MGSKRNGLFQKRSDLVGFGIVIGLLVFLLVVVISFYIVDALELLPKITRVVKLILGVIFLIVLLERLGIFAGRF